MPQLLLDELLRIGPHTVRVGEVRAAQHAIRTQDPDQSRHVVLGERRDEHALAEDLAGPAREPPAGPRAVARHAALLVDRLEQIPARLAFLFDYSATRALEQPDIRAEAQAALPVITVLAEELSQSGQLLDKEMFRAAAARVRERTGQKGKALFHPIRLALTGESEGLELDLAVPAIEAGASLQSSSISSIPGAAERAQAFASALK